MKTIAPNIAIPIENPIAEATLKTLERKSVSGRTGSAARRSCHTNATRSAAPASARPTIVAELHGYVTPPQVVTRISAPTLPARRAAPR